MVERGQFGRAGLGRIEDGGDQPIDRLGVGHSVEAIVDDPHPYAVRAALSLVAGIDAAEIRAVRQTLLDRQIATLLGPPEQIGSGPLRLLPQVEAEEVAVRQTEHSRAERRDHLARQSQFADIAPGDLGGEQHMGAALHQANHPHLREGALSMAVSGPPERGLQRRIVCDVKRAAVQTYQPPTLEPGALRARPADRLHRFLVEPFQRLRPKPRAGLRNARLRRHLDRPAAIVQPMDALQKTTQHFAVRSGHEQRHGDHVVDHQMRRQFPLALARLARLRQNPTNIR